MIKLGQWRKRRGKAGETVVDMEYHIPAPYDRVVAQLILEVTHGDDHDSHESRRRACYAAQTLDAFGDELKSLKDQVTSVKVDGVKGYALTPTFRSKVLTPILQRQRVGIHDAYTPFVRAGINNRVRRLSFQDVTDFYLKVDPVDPIYIISYRRNLLYQPDARWHLGVLMKGGIEDEEEAAEYYNMVRENHDKVLASIGDDSRGGVDSRGVSLLNAVEINVIIDEGIEEFFQEELDAVVRYLS